MRIIGGKDYYDGGAGFDTDPTRVFSRTNHLTTEKSTKPRLHTLDKTTFDAYAQGENRYSRLNIPVAPIYVIFCGTLYSGAFHRRTSWDGHKVHTHYDTAWTADAVRELIKAHGGVFADKDRHFYFHADYINNTKVESFVEPKPLKGDDLDLIIKENILVSIGLHEGARYKRSVDWFDNTDGLKNFGFASVVDTWQAYQQLDQFVGSQLAKEENNMVKLSDKELIAKHGFDELNFRNQVHPGKPRNRA